MSIKKLVILGHPDRASFCGHLADTYVAAARAAGHEVSLMALGELEFDPVLRLGYKQIQPLEPDLLQLQEAIREAQQLVFIYPNWWGSMPALLKGMFDRLLLPGFAFHYQSPDAIRWQRLLSGRTAQAIVTMDTPAWYYRWFYRWAGHHQLKRCILDFCGIKPVRFLTLASIKHSTDARRARWLEAVRQLASQ